MASTVNNTKTTVINGDDLASALNDPRIAVLVDDACAYGAALAAAGKDHSLDPSDRG